MTISTKNPEPAPQPAGHPIATKEYEMRSPKNTATTPTRSWFVRGRLVGPTPAFGLVWQIHAAAFALALPMLGTTCIGSALAAHASGLTPAWQRLAGLVGGSLLLAAGLGNLAIADGSPLIFVGLLGFVAWLVWL